MLVKINFFKPSGKWYTEESVDIPNETPAWEFHKHLPTDRLQDMVAVAMETPWGFPSMRASVEEQVDARIVHVMIGKDGERLADYESFGEAVERITRAAETTKRLGHEDAAKRLSESAATLAEHMVGK